jgi:hypothetical protein
VAITVKQVREAIQLLPDDAPVVPIWHDAPPADHEPGVELFAIEGMLRLNDVPALAIRVGLFYINEDEPENSGE